jgi:hypothetical protein
MTPLAIKRTDRFSMHFYAQTVFGLLGQPRKFYDALPQSIGMMPVLGFLAVSAVFSSIASLLNTNPQNLYLTGGIYLFNAVGMVLIMAGLGYMVMTLCIGKKVSFARLFSIYALSSGVTLLVSWIPFLVVLTEPWKWWLIGTGIIKGCGLKLKEAVLIIALSLAVWILLYWSLIPIITR